MRGSATPGRPQGKSVKKGCKPANQKKDVIWEKQAGTWASGIEMDIICVVHLCTQPSRVLGHPTPPFRCGLFAPTAGAGLNVDQCGPFFLGYVSFFFNGFSIIPLILAATIVTDFLLHYWYRQWAWAHSLTSTLFPAMQSSLPTRHTDWWHRPRPSPSWRLL